MHKLDRPQQRRSDRTYISCCTMMPIRSRSLSKTIFDGLIWVCVAIHNHRMFVFFALRFCTQVQRLIPRLAPDWRERYNP
jgi:hypothetical protein